MTTEEKQLLLKDLSARLPYGVIIHIHYIDTDDYDTDDYDRQLIGEDLDFIELDRRNCKPYLRPMSSMTEEEKKWYHLYGTGSTSCTASCAELVIDWLNEHHFDYRMLIEIGLALEAPEGMYKTK